MGLSTGSNFFNLCKRKAKRTLLAELGLSLLDGGEDHVADGGGREPVQMALDAEDGNDVKVLGTTVVGTVDDGSNGETKGHPELSSGCET